MMDLKVFGKSIGVKTLLNLRSVVSRSKISRSARFSKISRNNSTVLTERANAIIDRSSPCMGSSLETAFTEVAVIPETSSQVSLDKLLLQADTSCLNNLHLEVESAGLLCHNGLDSLGQLSLGCGGQEQHSICRAIPGCFCQKFLNSDLEFIGISASL